MVDFLCSSRSLTSATYTSIKHRPGQWFAGQFKSYGLRGYSVLKYGKFVLRGELTF